MIFWNGGIVDGDEIGTESSNGSLFVFQSNLLVVADKIGSDVWHLNWFV